MAYSGDKNGRCKKEHGKQVKLVKCQFCGGRGKSQTTQCGNGSNKCQQTGYQCENAGKDEWHTWQ